MDGLTKHNPVRRTIEFSLVEIENLIMMAENASRYHTGGNNEYARTAVAKLKAARKEILAEYESDSEVATV